ncbi:sn-glycerol-3-phosphate ABC transporter ATP-binding protein UgpC [Nocardia terpenica]|uniref:ABC transporter ATP-binding protein n=1 Tax=Nocardia terpenica TaxID=455432 RepID=UPI0018936204|nr:sn-glycerol-3-phosphate ABC transporter ATP-binding protein UgpC [Nocardia terpenica]MBF6063100.1 sn-glycerol-3-phosphate ABC transporter ATP-binding protein UgpC [Nocardia terpenica]MBF6104765.1 sn-glycerol-3-phosphate ABC transporter ATP-binding protein UgpC [Nocardia terpenica]MBF6112799.1 sn-glycerol-3-phosphate ABC transporter ATP-binding protein UgpC [Nocardia terpenica]MBF6118493.1 sn-glycerol-3-phosphate ABC transporter ATP-binding protein UgpC [Nocardia terpenica]MBF6154972.1 sn-gl
MATVQFDSATHLYPGAPTPAVDALDIDIADGEFLVLVGPSGCGKSTSLRMLAGLESVESGRIMIGERDVTGLPPRARDVAMVFQSYALYPNMTVAENMGFALRNAGMNKSDTMVRVREAATMLELEHLLDRKPAKLSGGQRQRVAMGRAIVRRPQVFCMDEPLSNLDAKLRVSTRAQIAALQKRLGTTTVYVTHDQVEAMTMGDRVAVLKDGKLQQIAAPRDLYDDPDNTFVAGFIGSPAMNLLEAPVRDGAAVIDELRIPLPRSAADRDRDRVVVGIRPETWEVTTAAGNALAVEVELLEELGAESFVYAHGITDDWSSRSGKLVSRIDRRFRVALGDRLLLTPKTDEVYFFDATTEERLR